MSDDVPTEPAGSATPGALARNCFVVGSGRSGTSMLTGVIAGAGYHVGDNLIVPRQANPKGFFEDRTVNALNEDLLAQVMPARPSGPAARLYKHRARWGQRWLMPLPMGTNIPVPPDVRAQIERLCATQPFCYKDPRFCYTLPAWRDHLEPLPVALCVFREPGRTVDSILREAHEAAYLRDLRMSRRRALETWTSMYRHVLERHRHRGTWVFVHFDQVVDGTGIDRVEEALGVPLDRTFADAALARSTDDGAGWGRAATEVYTQLCALAGYVPRPRS